MLSGDYLCLLAPVSSVALRSEFHRTTKHFSSLRAADTGCEAWQTSNVLISATTRPGSDHVHLDWDREEGGERIPVGYVKHHYGTIK